MQVPFGSTGSMSIIGIPVSSDRTSAICPKMLNYSLAPSHKTSARFREAEHADVIRAAELAGVHEMVQHMPNGYDTQIGDGGHALSGGQRQRIGLARALFGKPAIVVLDEPNANLDSTGETALVGAVRHLKQIGSTVIFVTHKTNMLTLADKVLLMEQGTVRLYGEREEVLAKIFGGPKVGSFPTATPCRGRTDARSELKLISLEVSSHGEHFKTSK